MTIKALHDHECTVCGYEHEEYIEWDNHSCFCPLCENLSIRVYKAFKGIQHDAPSWMKDVIEVVDKDGTKPHCNEFLKRQTRASYKNWLDGEGIRPLAEGESMKKGPNNTSSLRRKVRDSFKDRNSITIRG